MYGIPKNTYVEVLNPHKAAKTLDHEFQSPTYLKPIVLHIDNYKDITRGFYD